LIRWVLAIFVLFTVFYPLLPSLDKIWVGRLPGDVRFRFRGLVFCLPFGSALMWSVLAFLAAAIVRLL
jgi:hypothetical protein